MQFFLFVNSDLSTQLKATLNIKNNNGTQFTITFQKEEPAEMV